MKNNKAELKILKKELSHWKKQAHDYKNYSEVLEREKSDLLGELSSISVGFTLSNQNIGWNTETKLQDRAARKVKEFAMKENRSKPMDYFYF